MKKCNGSDVEKEKNDLKRGNFETNDHFIQLMIYFLFIVSSIRFFGYLLSNTSNKLNSPNLDQQLIRLMIKLPQM